MTRVEHLAEMTLIDENMQLILTEDPIRKSKFLTNASGATWWLNFSIMQVMPPGGQNLKGRSKPRVSGWVTFFSEFICRQEN